MVKINTEINKTKYEDMCEFCGEVIEANSVIARTGVFANGDWDHKKIHRACFDEYSMSVWEASVNKEKPIKGKPGRPALNITPEQHRERASFKMQWHNDQNMINSAYDLRPEKIKDTWIRVANRLAAFKEEDTGPGVEVIFPAAIVKKVKELDYDLFQHVFEDIRMINESPELYKETYPDGIPNTGDPAWVGRKILAVIDRKYDGKSMGKG